MASVQEEPGIAHVGTMGWGYRFWVGKLYPEGINPEGYLTEYARRFNSVEIDSTFYRIPSKAVIESWSHEVPEGFRFAVKFPQSITHAPKLRFDLDKLEVFLGNIAVLGPKLGPLLLQFPPFLKPYHDALSDLLDELPKDWLIAAEFRNGGWFGEETYRVLREHGVTLVQTNRRGSADVETGSFSYIRLEGDRKQVNGERGEVELDRSTETLSWAEKALQILGRSRDIYCYFSKYYSGYPPFDVCFFSSAIGAKKA